jgi:hypothetical protein
VKATDHREFVHPNTGLVSSDFTLMFWDAWKKMCDEKDLNFGTNTTGSFITTMHPPTRPWKPQSLWLTTKCLSFPILHTRRT